MYQYIIIYIYKGRQDRPILFELLDFPALEKMDDASSFEGQPLRTGPALASLLDLRLEIILLRHLYKKPIFPLTWLK